MSKDALTKTRCDNAVTRDREYVIWDARVAGFGLRIQPNGHRSFVLVYRMGRGRKAPLRKVTIGTFGSPWTVDTARTEAKRLLSEVTQDRDPAAKRAIQRAGTDTVAWAIDEWLKRDQKNRSQPETRRIMAAEVIPVWGERRLASIKKRDVLELIDGITDRGVTTRANRVLAWAKRFLSWCASRDLIETNPAAYVEKPHPEQKRDRKLDDRELLEVWRALDGLPAPYTAGVRLLILTGCRLQEIFSAQWSEFDREHACLRLPAERSKNKEGRGVWLSPPAVAIIDALPRFAGSPWVITARGKVRYGRFGQDKRLLDQAIAAARQKAKLEEPMQPWVHHDLRRSIASGMQKLGIRLEVIETVLGHVSGSRAGIVGTYQRHAFEAEARAAILEWGCHVDGLVSGREAKVVPLRGRQG